MFIDTDNQNFIIARRYVRVGNDLTALEYYTKAAEEGYLPAMVACGQYYLYGGKNIPIDLEKAKFWFQQASELNNFMSINILGHIYEDQNNFELALQWYKRGAELGDVTAMMNLAGVYRFHYKDLKSANFWVKKAESCTGISAFVALAEYYAEATGIRNHVQKSIYFYEKAVELGNSYSLNALGNMYLRVNDLKAAKNCFERSAKIGFIEGMANYGFMLIFSGDFENAYYWLKRAVKGGSFFAMRIMGDINTMRRQFPRALRWYRKALSAGDPDAPEDIRKIKRMLKFEKADYKLRARRLNEPKL